MCDGENAVRWEARFSYKSWSKEEASFARPGSRVRLVSRTARDGYETSLLASTVYLYIYHDVCRPNSHSDSDRYRSFQGFPHKSVAQCCCNQGQRARSHQTFGEAQRWPNPKSSPQAPAEAERANSSAMEMPPGQLQNCQRLLTQYANAHDTVDGLMSFQPGLMHHQSISVISFPQPLTLPLKPAMRSPSQTVTITLSMMVTSSSSSSSWTSPAAGQFVHATTTA